MTIERPPGAESREAAASERLTPTSTDYDEHVRREVEHYTDLYKDENARQRLMEPSPEAWRETNRRTAELIRAATGHDVPGHVYSLLRRRAGSRLLSLGCGPGGVELMFAQNVRESHVVGLDLNPNLVALGNERARELNVNAEFQVADLNRVVLPENEYDVVYCWASLHHLTELEHVAAQIQRTLKPDGILVVGDVVMMNGSQMWPETRPIVQSIWATLPERFRINHTGYRQPKIDEQIWEPDTSRNGFECIRSEDIIPVLSQTFETIHFVPYRSISRRFFHTMYGPNYDLSRPLDKALFDWIWELDNYYLGLNRLRPEDFFGMYRCK